MKNVLISLLLASGASVLLMSCGENQVTPGYNPAIGPFDENGNYVEAWADNPPKSRRARRTASNPKPKTTPKPKNQPEPKRLAKHTPKPQPKAQPKPRPKQIKVKPRTIRHAVKTGDTLYGLARKYGSSVSKIQKANGLRGTTIINGTSLVIPR